MSAVRQQRALNVARPSLIREPTENFLTYYASSAPGEPVQSAQQPSQSPQRQALYHTRATSNGSTSSSDYSTEDIPQSPLPQRTSPQTRRPSNPSEGGSDRRRLAIVQTTPTAGSARNVQALSRPGFPEHVSSSESLRTRRKLGLELADLTLVAPPDADEDTYSYLTPPSTAPAAGAQDRMSGHASRTSPGLSRHARSASEAVGSQNALRHRSSRDVGIVGTSFGPPTAASARSHSPGTTGGNSGRSRHTQSATDGTMTKPTVEEGARGSLTAPIFQMPHSRSVSPSLSSDASVPSKSLSRLSNHSPGAGHSSRHHTSSSRSPEERHTDHDITPTRKTHTHSTSELHSPPLRKFAVHQQLVITPEIGQSKRIYDRVAGPVLSSAAAGNLLTTSTRRAGEPLRSNSHVDLSIPFSPPPMTTIFTPLTPASPSTMEFPSVRPAYQPTAGPLPVPQVLVSPLPTPKSSGAYPRVSTFNAPPSRILNYESTSPAPPRPPRLHSPPPISQSSSSRSSRGDLDAVKQALQLPANVAAALARRLGKGGAESHAVSLKSSVSQTSLQSAFSPMMEEESDTGKDISPSVGATNPISMASSSASSLNPKKSVHVREGARHSRVGASTTTSATDLAKQLDSQVQASHAMLAQRQASEEVLMEELVADVDQSIEAVGLVKTVDPTPPTPTVPPKEKEDAKPLGDLYGNLRRPALELKREPSWVSEVGVRSTPSSEHTDPFSVSSRSPTVPDKDGLGGYDELGLSVPITPSGFKNNFAKRFSSLPRTPSYMSLKADDSRTPSPSLPSLPPPMRKTRSQWPSAMHCTDVVARKTMMERCVGYADKINELYRVDCGLSDWIVDAQIREHSGRNGRRATIKPSAPSSYNFVSQPRHLSHSSMQSEATFPVRSDSTLATDLTRASSSDDSHSPPGAPPALPYPALALSLVPSRSSSTLPPPSSTRSIPVPISTGKAGFFASLGRKASLAKPGPKSPTQPTPHHKGGLLTKAPPHLKPDPRPINIPSSHSPSVPGGPRAVPYRSQRSQTIMISSPFPSNASLDYGVALARRKSQSSSPVVTPPAVISIGHDPEFARQVDKLADLLPHADKQILAGYLRRAGQDITAIGLYLEDEKLGRIRRA